MPEQTAHPSHEQLSAYTRGQLPPDEAVAIETHISDCEPCCETIVGLSSDDTFIGLLKEARQLPTDETVDVGATAFAHEVPAPLAKHPRYEIVGLIGRGGMGDVYKATHRKMERTVALKVINRGLVRKTKVVDRFHREVKAAAQLSHPNIVTAFDADQADDFHFMVMEYVDGVDLSQTVKDRGALPVAEACEYIRQAAIGLQHAHEQGMVHRDIKPHNLMVTADGTVKVLDFGLASLAPEAVSNAESGEVRSDLTAAGAIMGTPDFISPEQAEDARQADIRSDIYSLGATLYFLLSGRVPFADGSVMHKLKSHASVEPARLDSLRDDIPDGLVAIVFRMMAKDPDERYLTPSEVAEALESFLRTWRPEKAESHGQEPSNGGDMSGTGGQTSGANDMSPDWIPVLGKWLFYMSLIPIALLVLDTFFWSDGASDAPDRTMFYIGTSVALSTIGGILAGIHQFNSGDRDNHRKNRWSESQTMLIGFIILGAGTFYLFETDHGVVRIAVNDPSLQVSILGQTITMEDGIEKPLTITPGEWPLLVSKEDAGFRFHTDSFRLRRGDEITFKVEVLKDEIVVLKDGEPFDRQEIFDLRRELQDADDRSPASTSPGKPELKVTGKTVNKGTAGLPSLYDWNFKGRDVGDLKVRLLLAQNGKSEVIQEFDFEEIPTEFANKVRMEVRDDATGADRKRRVNAVLFVESPVPSRSATVNEDKGLSIDVEAPFSNKIERADLEPIEPGQTELLLALSYWKGDMTHDLSMESMTAATKDGNVTFLFVTLDWSPTFVPTINGKDTEQILKQMTKTYAECKSYCDSGVIKSVIFKDTDSAEVTLEHSFITVFMRPDRFRFEIMDQYDDELLISLDGEDVQTSWDIEPGFPKPESLELAMAQAVGFTGGDVGRIPAMLMPKKLDGWVDLDLIDPIQIEDGKLQNVECFRLEYNFRDEQIILWIDKQSHLVRRIDERIESDGIRISERTTTYDPTIDGKVTDKMLEFDPPAGRAADDSASTLPEEDLEPIQGDWETESLTESGKQLATENGFGGLLLQIKGNRFVIKERTPNGEKSEVNTGRIEIGITATPKTIDFIDRDQPNQRSLGIYELKDGVLRICLAEQGGPDAPAGAPIPDANPLKRPTTFDSPAGSNIMLMEFRRESDNALKTVSQLVRQANQPGPVCQLAIEELLRREDEGLLDSEQVNDLIDLILKCQADRERSWRTEMGDLIEKRWLDGTLDRDIWDKYTAQFLVDICELKVRPRIVIGSPSGVLVQRNFRDLRCGSGKYIEFLLRETNGVTRVGSTIVGRVDLAGTTQIGHDNSEMSSANSSALTKQQWEPIKPGRHKITFDVELAILESVGPEASEGLDAFASRKATFKTEATFLPAGQSTVNVNVDLAMKDEVDRAMTIKRVETAPMSRPTTSEKYFARVVLSVQPRPIDNIFTIVLRDGETEYDAGSHAHVIKAEEGNGLISMASIAADLSGKRIDVILRPAPDEAESSIDLFEIWGEEIVFEDVLVQ